MFELSSLLWFSLFGVGLSVKVHQTPSVVFKNPGETVQVICTHERTDYIMMHWYQKPYGDLSLKRIGHIYYDDKDYDDAFKKHFTFEGDLSGETAKKASMSITDLQPEHSAVYYCAASDAQ